jgi:hypothetical protein
LGQKPKFLKVRTSQFRDYAAEKIALEFLERMNYKCTTYFDVRNDLIVQDSKLSEISRSLFDNEITYREEHLKWFRKLMKKYHHKVPPSDLRWDTGTQSTWDEYRKRQLRYGKWHIKNVEEFIKGLKLHEKRIEETWGEHVENLRGYIDWLEKYEHKQKYPDFIAIKENKVYVIEVKSQTQGKSAFVSGYQKDALVKACDFGLTPLLVNVPIDISIEVGNPEITVVKNGSE